MRVVGVMEEYSSCVGAGGVLRDRRHRVGMSVRLSCIRGVDGFGSGRDEGGKPALYSSRVLLMDLLNVISISEKKSGGYQESVLLVEARQSD